MDLLIRNFLDPNILQMIVLVQEDVSVLLEEAKAISKCIGSDMTGLIWLNSLQELRRPVVSCHMCAPALLMCLLEVAAPILNSCFL